eukprot:GDKJ01062165.1.p1 GENE.GDKJ01062165.1~~GDKJ01062165.1.p1  ORF type:complete len:588 (+),score=120.22 GDKJ01062165.1:260-1765(+)
MYTDGRDHLGASLCLVVNMGFGFFGLVLIMIRSCISSCFNGKSSIGENSSNTSLESKLSDASNGENSFFSSFVGKLKINSSANKDESGFHQTRSFDEAISNFFDFFFWPFQSSFEYSKISGDWKRPSVSHRMGIVAVLLVTHAILTSIILFIAGKEDANQETFQILPLLLNAAAWISLLNSAKSGFAERRDTLGGDDCRTSPEETTSTSEFAAAEGGSGFRKVIPLHVLGRQSSCLSSKETSSSLWTSSSTISDDAGIVQTAAFTTSPDISPVTSPASKASQPPCEDRDSFFEHSTLSSSCPSLKVIDGREQNSTLFDNWLVARRRYFGLSSSAYASLFVLLSESSFHLLGHRKSLETLPLSAGFAFDGIYHPWLSPILVGFRMLLPYLLVGVVCPLLALWESKEEVRIWKGLMRLAVVLECRMLSVINSTMMTILLTTIVSWISLLFLMEDLHVWALFAPHWLMHGLLLASCMLSVLSGTCILYAATGFGEKKVKKLKQR